MFPTPPGTTSSAPGNTPPSPSPTHPTAHNSDNHKHTQIDGVHSEKRVAFDQSTEIADKAISVLVQVGALEVCVGREALRWDSGPPSLQPPPLYPSTQFMTGGHVFNVHLVGAKQGVGPPHDHRLRRAPGTMIVGV